MLTLANSTNNNVITLQPASSGTGSNTVTLPNETGQICTTAGSAACTAVYAAASGSGSYVNLQGSTPGTVQTGSLNISGTAIAGYFSGNGASLTSLNGSNISSGTVASTYLPNNITYQGNSFNGVSQLVQTNASGNISIAGSITGVGLNAGTGSITGTGGATITGTTSINVSGSSTTSIGNSTGGISLLGPVSMSSNSLSTSGSITAGSIASSSIDANTSTPNNQLVIGASYAQNISVGYSVANASVYPNGSSTININNGGTTGSKTYSYAVTGVTSGGTESSVLYTGTTILGNTTLSTTNYNYFSFSTNVSYSYYKIYRMGSSGNSSGSNYGSYKGQLGVSTTTSGTNFYCTAPSGGAIACYDKAIYPIALNTFPTNTSFYGYQITAIINGQETPVQSVAYGTGNGVFTGSSYGSYSASGTNSYINQNTYTITGYNGASFTSAMNGGTIVYADGTTATITYVSSTTLTSSVNKYVTTGKTPPGGGAYTIFYSAVSGYNLINWPSVTNATGYNVYRSYNANNPSTTGQIASNISGNTVTDTGNLLNSTLPSFQNASINAPLTLNTNGVTNQSSLTINRTLGATNTGNTISTLNTSSYSNDTYSTSNYTNLNNSPGSNRYIVAAVNLRGSTSAPSSVTYAGYSMHQVGSVYIASTHSTTIWALKEREIAALPLGSNTVYVTIASSLYTTITAMELQNVDQTIDLWNAGYSPAPTSIYNNNTLAGLTSSINPSSSTDSLYIVNSMMNNNGTSSSQPNPTVAGTLTQLSTDDNYTATAESWSTLWKVNSTLMPTTSVSITPTQATPGTWNLSVMLALHANNGNPFSNTASAASITNTCSVACVDNSNVLALTQSSSTSTGAVLSISNSGSGADIALGSGLITSAATTSGNSNGVVLQSGSSGSGSSGSVTIKSGGGVFGNSGDINVQTSSTYTGTGGTSGNINITTGSQNNGYGGNAASGNITITTGTVGAGETANSGSITIGAGSNSGSGSAGNVIFKNGSNSSSAYTFQNASGSVALGINTSGATSNTITNPSFEGGSTSGWSGWGSGTLASDCTQGYSGSCALKITSTAANGGVYYSTTELTNVTFNEVSFYATAFTSTPVTGLQVGYGTSSSSQTPCTASGTNANLFSPNSASSTVSQYNWTQYTCVIFPPSSGSTNYIFISSTNASDVFDIDAVQWVSAYTTPFIYNPVGQITLGGTITSPVALQNLANSTNSLQISNASGTSLLAADTTNMQIVIGTGANTVALSSSGVTLYGTAQRARTITLTPEYSGAVLDNGSGDPGYSSSVGTMTAGFDSSASIGSSYGENYYQWTTSQSSAQSYDVVARIPLPSDFSSFNGSTPISINTKGSSGGSVTAYLWDTGSATSETNWSYTGPGCSISVTTSWVKNTGCTVSGSNSADGIMTLRIKMVAAASGGTTQLGNISLKYLSKW
jgi:hypothetical protein